MKYSTSVKGGREGKKGGPKVPHSGGLGRVDIRQETRPAASIAAGRGECGVRLELGRRHAAAAQEGWEDEAEECAERGERAEGDLQRSPVGGFGRRGDGGWRWCNDSSRYW